MSDQFFTDYDLDFLEEEGERIYHDRLKSLLEPQHKGKTSRSRLKAAIILWLILLVML